ncbi:unnamed protein product [Cylicocyclus nassatus]|uniref:Uncharacterized protein n=1 Tax=Cylicocyclus nassatus TaxID=53992 RepID=A0AA36LZG3_CYLNA|nr:unnamed protein product [Cylicocyclus nassatus]
MNDMRGDHISVEYRLDKFVYFELSILCQLDHNYMLLLLLLTAVSTVHSLTCYNGARLLRTSAVGESVEECPSGAYCYNMTANVAFIVDAVKAGCSTWRCLLARDTCISTTFQMIPVSLCCCSTDRCNVGENRAYSSIAGGNDGGFSRNGGDSSNTGGNTRGSGGGNNGGANEEQKKGWFGGLFGKPDQGTPPRSPSGSGSGGGHWDAKDIENKFKGSDIDHHGGGDGGEEVFEKIDVRHTTRPPRRLSSNDRAPSTSNDRHGSTGGGGREIELDV